MRQEYRLFKNLVKNLTNRADMYVFGASYHYMVAFLHGYFLSIKDTSGEDISSDFQNWLRSYVGSHFVETWSGYVFFEMCGKNEKKSKEKLLELFEMFLLDVERQD